MLGAILGLLSGSLLTLIVFFLFGAVFHMWLIKHHLKKGKIPEFLKSLVELKEKG